MRAELLQRLGQVLETQANAAFQRRLDGSVKDAQLEMYSRRFEEEEQKLDDYKKELEDSLKPTIRISCEDGSAFESREAAIFKNENLPPSHIASIP